VATGALDLDREYPGILPGSWVVLTDPYHVEAYKVERAGTRAREDFTLAAKVTRLKLSGEYLTSFDRRATVVWCEPEGLTRVGEPDLSPVSRASLTLAGEHENLTVGCTLAVYGPDTAGRACGEIVRVAHIAREKASTTLLIDPPLKQQYVRDAVVVNANVARATHGQTAPDEVLGGGNAALPFQRFVLKGKPLTHVPSAQDPSGAQAALTLRVGGVAWTRVPYLHGQAPDALVYALRYAADGTTVVELGDGVMGARLPAGIDNVVASYRTGVGISGEAAAGRASLLTRRPLGIDSAVNPTAFSGGADPESAEEIRKNAASTVLTLGRLVSIQDYEDFANGFAGVGKALAIGIWVGQRRLVHLTVGSASGKPLERSGPVLVELSQALANYQDPVHRVVVDSFIERRFGLSASLLVDAAYRWDDIKLAARAALLATFDFAHRRFGQGVTPAEVLTVLQSVPGVRAVDLDHLTRTDAPYVSAPPELLLEARGPQTSGGARQKAELLLVSDNEPDIQLSRMAE
jgi:predicted phage baseplate assembly protein